MHQFIVKCVICSSRWEPASCWTSSGSWPLIWASTPGGTPCSTWAPSPPGPTRLAPNLNRGQNEWWSKVFLYSTTQYLTVKTSACAFHLDCLEENTNIKIHLEWNKQNFSNYWRKILDPIMWRSRRIKRCSGSLKGEKKKKKKSL